MTDTAGPTFDQAGHIRELEAQIAQLREHETIRAKTIADHQTRLTAADAALAEVAELRKAVKTYHEMHHLIAGALAAHSGHPTEASSPLADASSLIAMWEASQRALKDYGAELLQLRGVVQHQGRELRDLEAARAAVAFERDEAINDKEHLRAELAEVRRQRDYAQDVASQRYEGR